MWAPLTLRSVILVSVCNVIIIHASPSTSSDGSSSVEGFSVEPGNGLVEGAQRRHTITSFSNNNDDNSLGSLSSSSKESFNENQGELPYPVCYEVNELDNAMKQLPSPGQQQDQPEARTGDKLTGIKGTGDHIFIQHAPLSCYNLNAGKGQEINHDINENDGCNAFQTPSSKISNFISCVHKIVAFEDESNNVKLFNDKKSWMNSLLDHLIFISSSDDFRYFQLPFEEQLTGGIRSLLYKLGNAENVEKKHDRLNVIIEVIVNGNEEINSCVGDLSKLDNEMKFRDMFRCLPVYSGSVGMKKESGLTTINQESEAVVIYKSCDVHPMCARLATAELLNFNLVNFVEHKREGLIKRGSSRLENVMKNRKEEKTSNTGPSLEECKGLTESNSRLYTSCWVKAVRHVCASNPACCPSKDVHDSCAKDEDSESCSIICSSMA